MSESADVNVQEYFDLFLLQSDSDEIRRFFGDREVTEEQMASMKEHARRRQAFRGWAEKAERRRGRLAARAEKRATQKASME